MALVRWQPFRDLVSLQERMNQMFEGSAARNFPRAGSEEDWVTGSWAPAVDIHEHEGNLVLKAEIPGVDPKKVDIRLENNILTLSGERIFEGDVKRDNYHRVERSYGAFSRAFTLPSVVDQERIAAEYKDGILTLTLPKKEEAKPKQIAISVAH